jgi:8-oxo-dGTP pyrophosphatase MutT (NUDIX family)
LDNGGIILLEFWDILDDNRNPTGRLHERGKPLGQGENHLVVHVWIMNDSNEFLIAKRTPNKSFPNMWECVGGSAVAGDGSLTTALKETEEELGVTLDPENGKIFKQYKRLCEDCSFGGNGGGDFVDVWLFRQNVDISTVTLCPDETCDVMYAGKDIINRMIDEGTFIGREIFSYIDEL